MFHIEEQIVIRIYNICKQVVETIKISLRFRIILIRVKRLRVLIEFKILPIKMQHIWEGKMEIVQGMHVQIKT